MLEVRNITAGYKNKMVLFGASLRAERGEITTIVGHNGCGKSTLLKAVVGTLPVKEGEVFVQGSPLSSLSKNQAAKLMAYLPQSKNTPDITAGHFVPHGRFPYLSYPRRYADSDRKIALGAMEQMGISELWSTPLSELSGGMRQKVYIAMALAKQSEIILMDEPTTYLDVGQQVRFTKTVKSLADQGKTVVLVLHDILLALTLSDQLCIMENGVIDYCGTPSQVLASGALQNMYDIDIGMIETETGFRYYYK